MSPWWGFMGLVESLDPSSGVLNVILAPGRCSVRKHSNYLENTLREVTALDLMLVKKLGLRYKAHTSSYCEWKNTFFFLGTTLYILLSVHPQTFYFLASRDVGITLHLGYYFTPRPAKKKSSCKT